jgi:hypothetical protein
MTEGIRRQQRFSNYQKPMAQPETFAQPLSLNEREQQEFTKVFECTHVLA